MVATLALPVVALGLLLVLQRLEVWSLQQPLPHDPPPPPGYVDPLEGSDLLADLTPQTDPQQEAPRRVVGPDPA